MVEEYCYRYGDSAYVTNAALEVWREQNVPMEIPPPAKESSMKASDDGPRLGT